MSYADQVVSAAGLGLDPHGEVAASLRADPSGPRGSVMLRVDPPTGAPIHMAPGDSLQITAADGQVFIVAFYAA